MCVTQVWDIQDQNCLLTLWPKSHRIQGDIQTCHYSSLSKTLAIATDQMNALSLTLKYVLSALLCSPSPKGVFIATHFN